jgi:hypothetical protein
MSEGNTRLVQALYWFVNDELEPLALNIGDGKFLCFFSTRWNAETFKQGQTMPPGRWTMLSTESADHLIEVCERANREGYTDFALTRRRTMMAGTGGGASMSSKTLSSALPEANDTSSPKLALSRRETSSNSTQADTREQDNEEGRES